MVRVSGRNIVDDFGQVINLRGFNIWGNDWIYGFLDREPYAEQWAIDKFMPLSLAHMQQIKRWGFNVIRVPLFWTFHFEADQNDVGNYGKFEEGYPLMPLLKTLIRMANEAGLYVIPTIRVCYDPVTMPYWAGWSTHDYVVYNQTDSAGMKGLDRYANFFRWFVSELDAEPNVIGYMPWMVPFHGQVLAEEDERISLYNSVVSQRIIATVRAVSNKIIFWSPVHCGAKGEIELAQRYATDVPPPFADKNVVYNIMGFGWYSVAGLGAVWDGIVETLRNSLTPGKNHQDTYNVPMLVSETGLDIHATSPERPIRSDRLAMFRTLLQLFDDYPKNWICWEYSGPNSPFGVLDCKEPVAACESPLVPILLEHVPPTPKPPNILPIVAPFIFGGLLIGIAEGVK
jgi:hypothetical protein